MIYTVKQLAKLAGVSNRTLHYYDEIGLLKPSSIGENGYRYYDEEALLRLQQILFFRELDLSLKEIRAILDQPEFDVVQALNHHRLALAQKAHRLDNLIDTIDKTIRHLEGELDMSSQEFFGGFSEEQQKEYEEIAAQRYDADLVRASNQSWRNYSPDKQAQIIAEGNAVYADWLALLESGADPAGTESMAVAQRWHEQMRYFYEPSVAMLRGLGGGYADDPAFAKKFEALHPALPAYLKQAVSAYCERLEA